MSQHVGGERGRAASVGAGGKERGTRRLRVISDERTAMRLMGYDPNFIAKRVGDA